MRLYGRDSRNAITGITLIAGFASTVGWPLTALFESQFGWRGACAAWAVLHLVLGVPLNALLPKLSAPATSVGTGVTADKGAEPTPRHTSATAILLAFVFAVTWFIATAMAAHLPGLLQAAGASLATAVAVGALVGPSQVAGRLLEFGFLRKVHPLLSARIAALMHPLGAAVLLLMGSPAAALFAILHGSGNGILTIAKGTLPLVLFGPSGYGHRQGLLMLPARIAQALSPWLFGIALDRWHANALWISAALGAAAFVALLLMPKLASERASPATSVAA